MKIILKDFLSSSSQLFIFNRCLYFILDIYFSESKNYINVNIFIENYKM